MAPRSKLKIALAKEKGLNDVKLKQLKDKKKHKVIIKEKRKKGLLPDKKAELKDEEWEDEEDDEVDEEEEGSEDEDEDADNGLIDIEAEVSEGDESEGEELGATTSAAALLNESDTDSESEVEMEEKIQRIFKPKPILKKNDPNFKTSKADKKANKDAEKEDDDDDEESDIALSDLDDMADSDREDLYVQTRLTINNQPALLAALKRIALPRDTPTAPFSTHHVVISTEPTAPKIEDISDDLQREQELFSQCLEAATRARALLRKEGVPFSRPKDYFAEMVKDDGHMEKVKAKLIEDATNKKAAAEARKQRDLKKFGKQVQNQKLQERSKQKRETLEKIKELKKKRAEHGNNDLTKEADLFDVAVDTELNKNGKRGRGGEQNGRGVNTKRQKKDTKYGFGGKKRNSKSGDAASSGDLSGFNARKMKSQGSGAGPGGKKKLAKTARLGKNKRQSAGGGKR